MLYKFLKFQQKIYIIVDFRPGFLFLPREPDIHSWATPPPIIPRLPARLNTLARQRRVVAFHSTKVKIQPIRVSECLRVLAYSSHMISNLVSHTLKKKWANAFLSFKKYSTDIYITLDATRNEMTWNNMKHYPPLLILNGLEREREIYPRHSWFGKKYTRWPRVGCRKEQWVQEW